MHMTMFDHQDRFRRQYPPHSTIASRPTRSTSLDDDASSLSTSSSSSIPNSDHVLGIRKKFPSDVWRRRSKPPHNQSQSPLFDAAGGTFVPPPSKNNVPVESRVPASSKTTISTRIQHPYSDSSYVSRKSSRRIRLQSREAPVALTPEQKQLEELYLDARRHEAIVARVTSPSDMERMSYALPASKITPIPHKTRGGNGWGHRVSATTGSNVARTNTHAPTFRDGGGSKTTRASAAASLVLSEAEPAIDVYGESVVVKKRVPPKDGPLTDHRKRGWKQLLPQSFTRGPTVLFTAVEI
jgi:hypothetical protein